jgi:thiamine biosynthesis lipoprotein
MGKITGLFLGVCIVFCACTKPAITTISGNGLGTYYNITIAGKNDIAKSQIDSIITELNNTASIFNPNSLVSRINRNETDTLNPILKHILEISLQVCEETDGAFDFTVGALVNLWGFGNGAYRNTPPNDEIEIALQTVGYKKISIEGNRIVKENPNTQLNFNAVAKGYCVDMTAAFLTQKGLENFIVDSGGELCVRGKRAPYQKWRIGLQKPTETKDGAIVAEEFMELQDISVATSGNYRNYIEENGKRYGHTINPHTGYPEMSDLLSVTVMASTCALADAYATAFMVMGKAKAKEFVELRTGIEVYFISDFGFRVSGFERKCLAINI